MANQAKQGDALNQSWSSDRFAEVKDCKNESFGGYFRMSYTALFGL